MSIFCAPTGAMQFEITKRPDTGTLFPGEGGWVWVIPVERDGYKNSCQCRKVYKVIDFSGLAERHRIFCLSLIEKEPYKSIGMHVCSCFGHLIE